MAVEPDVLTGASFGPSCLLCKGSPHPWPPCALSDEIFGRFPTVLVHETARIPVTEQPAPAACHRGSRAPARSPQLDSPP
jgi:hypothetical protein